MGRVYAARRVEPPHSAGDPPEGSAGALKFLSSGDLPPLQVGYLKEMIDEEVRFSTQANHPRLIRTYGTVIISDQHEPQLNGTVVLAMEQAAGSLADALRAVSPPQAVPDAPRLIREISEGLVHLHDSGWVHGDLKPSNVLLMSDRSVRLADFGLTRELEGTHAYAPRLGSPDFLPPEWWTERMNERGMARRPTSDIWALGVIGHQLFTGGLHPFPGADSAARKAAVQAYGAGEAELRLSEAIPPHWRPILADCLSSDHATRSRHPASSLLARIHTATDGENSPPALGGRRGQRSKRRVLVTGSLSIASAALVWWLFSSLGDTGIRDEAATVTVFNAEVSCQEPRTSNCALGLARDPYARYTRENVIGLVWHGDVLPVDCYLDDGAVVQAENRASSTRWYRVHAPDVAWLPGVRVRPGTEPSVSRCER